MDALLKFLKKDIPLLELPENIVKESPKKNQKVNKVKKNYQKDDVKINSEEKVSNKGKKVIVGMGDHVPDFLTR